jgi:hypothetical protein
MFQAVGIIAAAIVHCIVEAWHVLGIDRRSVDEVFG